MTIIHNWLKELSLIMQGTILTQKDILPVQIAVSHLILKLKYSPPWDSDMRICPCESLGDTFAVSSLNIHSRDVDLFFIGRCDTFYIW